MNGSTRLRAGMTVIAGALATALVLTGCATSDDPGVDDGSWATQDPATVTGEVNFWQWGDSQEAVEKQIALFNETYPNVKVTSKTVPYADYASSLSAAIASGSGPDAFTLEPGAMAEQFAFAVADLTPLYASVLGADWQSSVASGPIDALTIDGKLVGAPNASTGAGTMLLNIGLLEELGIEYPDSISSVDDLVDFCQQVIAKDKQCLAIGAKDAWASQDVFQAIADTVEPGAYSEAVAGERPWTDDALVEAFDIWQSLFSNGVFQEGAVGFSQYPDASNLWQSGEAVAFPTGTWAAMEFIGATSIANQEAAGVANPKPIKSSVVGFPAVGGTEGTIFASIGSGTAIAESSKNKAAAGVWANWYSLSSSGNQKITADALIGVPAILDVDQDVQGLAYPEIAQPAIDWINESIGQTTEARSIPYPELTTALGTAMQESAVGTDSASVTATLQSVSESIAR